MNNKSGFALGTGILVIGAFACNSLTYHPSVEGPPTPIPLSDSVTLPIALGCMGAAEQIVNEIPTERDVSPDQLEGEITAACIENVQTEARLNGNQIPPLGTNDRPSRLLVAGNEAFYKLQRAGYYSTPSGDRFAHIIASSVAHARDSIKTIPVPTLTPHGQRIDQNRRANLQARLNTSPASGFRRG